MELATRQEFMVEYNSLIRNPGLGAAYKIEYADDEFDVAAAPWLRAMDNRMGERVVREMTFINAGWERYHAQKRAYGGVIALCEVWEPYVIGDKIEEKSFKREMDPESALLAARVLKRRDGVTPKATILEVYELPSLMPRNSISSREKYELDWMLNYMARTEILPCYKYAKRVAWNDKDVGVDAPIVIQAATVPSVTVPVPPAPPEKVEVKP